MMRIIATGIAGLAVAAGAVALAEAATPGADGHIAFQRFLLQDKPLQADIWVANPDGSGERRITRAPRGLIDGDPDWSRDGQRVAFQRCVSLDGPCTIWSVNADGSNPRRLDPKKAHCLNTESPAWSPSGEQVAFECKTRSDSGDIYSIAVINSDGSGVHFAVRGSAAVGFGEPQFSPNGSQLVLDRRSFAGATKIGTYVVNVDGTGLRRITPWSLRAGDHPDWSPDGKLILVRSSSYGAAASPQGNLFTVHPDGTALRRLTRFTQSVSVLQNGSFSPDGRSIVFATTEGAVKKSGSNLPDVFAMSLDGTGMRAVTRSKNWDGAPDWGPR